jgi:hypothetical protein
VILPVGQLETLIGSYGFPIAVCCYLLWERQHAIRDLKKAICDDLVGAIDDLKVEIVKLSERLK